MRVWCKWIHTAVLIIFTGIVSAQQPAGSAPPLKEDLTRRLQQFPRTIIDYDHSLLNENEKKVVHILIQASHYIDEIFWRQVSEENPELKEQLRALAETSDEYRKALEYFNLMKGRWDRLNGNEPFIGPFGNEGEKPHGAAFYPPNATKEEIEKWLAAHPAEKESIQSLFTVVRRDQGKLIAIPYSKYYRKWLEPAAEKLREAAALTENTSLKDYLTKRAEAFLNDDYYASDVAWIDLNSPIEVVIGPYEVYEDELFNWKASYESFVTVVDKKESENLAVYLKHLPNMEKNLPIPDEHKNPNRGSSTALKVVQEIYTAGDGRRGVQTAAFNLPNDEQVREKKGFKNVLLKNVMQAKFEQCGKPIALKLWDPSQVSKLSFDAFFNHVLFHELSHGLGPGLIKGPDGNRVETRLLLKNLYSTIEESKADVVGMWTLLYAIDQKLVTSFDTETLFITNSSELFRGMRFGITEAHGRGTAIQWNWYREKEAIVPSTDSHYKVDLSKIKSAVESLANELLMIEATGNYERAKALVDKYGAQTDEIKRVNETLKDIPVDIAPVFTAAGEK
jgi:hypothetical protein